MIIDHVVFVVRDPVKAAQELFERHGLGSERGDYHTFSGTRNWSVPLTPLTYLELLSIEDRTVAEGSEVGRQVIAREEAGGGLVAWAVLVDDVTVVSERLGIDIFDYTIVDDNGTLRGWRSVTGPPHLPFFIVWPNSEGRLQRWEQKYRRVGHTSAPIGFSELTISGTATEIRDWLRPHQLPLGYVAGKEGLVEARIATPTGEIVIA
jgi:Glyoxalase-like domain